MSALNPLKIFSGGAMRPLLRELVPGFERAYGVTGPELDELIACGAIVRDSVVNVTRSTVGLAVRAGAPQPDIGSVEALRRTLMEARSIAYSDGPSGAYVAGLLGKLGIAEAVAAKIKLTSGPVAELVARGEAEVGMQQIVAILPVVGAQLVGPLPAELQNVIIYAAGRSCAFFDAVGAVAFIGFIRGKEAKALMRANGLDPA